MLDHSQEGSWFALIVGYGRNAHVMSQALGERGYYALAFDSYAGALRDLHHLRPELLLVGRKDPSGNILDFLSKVQSLDRAPTTLVLMNRLDRDMVDQALEHGADDIVFPPHSVTSILLRSQVSKKNHGRAPRSAGRRFSLGRLTLDLQTRQVIDGAKPFNLSGREFELLACLMDSGGEVVSRAELLNDIWGADQGSEAVLDATIHRLRRRLEQELDQPNVVNTIRGVGYQLDYSIVAGVDPVAL